MLSPQRSLVASSLVLVLAGCGGDPGASSGSSGASTGGAAASMSGGAAGMGASTSGGEATTSGEGSGRAAPIRLLAPAGTITCDGAIAATSDGRGGVATSVDCSAAQRICAAGLGCVTCAPGTGTCAGEVGTYCLADGSGFATEVCDPWQAMACNGATGRCDGSCGARALGRSYLGCDYYPTVTANLTDSAVFHFAVTVSSTASVPAAVTVTRGLTTIAAIVVPPHSVRVIELPWVEALKGPSGIAIVPFPGSVSVPRGAYRLRSTEPVLVYQWSPIEYAVGNDLSYTTDASLLLPASAWTGTYRVAARHHFNGASGFYAVTAREDGTTVNVSPGPGGGLVKAGIPGIAANGSGQVVLDAGDVIEVVTAGAATPGDPDDVTGTLVSADKPVQVIAGHQCTYVPDDIGACDHLEESMFPEETLAADYLITAPGIPAVGAAIPNVQRVRIVATQPDTALVYDPPQPLAPASVGLAGAWVELLDSAASFRISASHPVLVAQYMEGEEAAGQAGDPAMVLAVGTAQYRSSYLFHAPPTYAWSYVNITAPLGAEVVLDEQPVPKASFTPIGATGYAVSRQALSSAGDGAHNASAKVPFGITVYGYGDYTSYWYPGGLNLAVLHQ